MFPRSTTILATGALALGATSLTACGSDNKGSTSTAGLAVKVTNPWVRVTAPSQTNDAAYMTISSASGDTLVKASVPTSVAKQTEMHKTTGSMGSGGSGMSSGHSMTGMKPVSSIAIPAGKAVQLKPGGYHVMLIGLAKPVSAGQTVPVTLTFQKAGTVTVDAQARES